MDDEYYNDDNLSVSLNGSRNVFVERYLIVILINIIVLVLSCYHYTFEPNQ